MLKWIGTTLLVLITVAIVGYYIAVFHSTTERELTCEGLWKRGGNGQVEIAHVVLTESRFWVWWTDSDGAIALETDKSPLWARESDVTIIGSGSLAVYLFGARGQVGEYREASRKLTFEFAEGLQFVGRCKNRE